MKNHILALLLLIFSSASFADDSILLSAIDYITENSELEYNNQPLPEIHRVSQQEMALRYYALDPAMPQSEIPKKVRNLELYGLYDFHNNILFLPENLAVWSWPYRYIIVHEMVHYLQNMNGHFDGLSCVSTLEPEAYKIMGQWQDDHNHDSPRANAFIVHIMANSCAEYEYK